MAGRMAARRCCSAAGSAARGGALPTLVLALLVLTGLFLLGRWLLAAEPRQILRGLRFAGIGVGASLVLFLAVTGRLGFIIGFVPLLLPLLRRWGRSRPARAPRAGRQSTLETANLRVRLDHDSGRVEGTVRSGPAAGRSLDDLGMPELAALWAEWRQTDGQSAAVLEAYLDRRFGAGWREPQQDEPRREAPPRGSRMDAAEALRVLGLAEGASEEEIRAAHRRLMKQFHPDHGGTDYLAAKLNEAKDVLLGR